MSYITMIKMAFYGIFFLSCVKTLIVGRQFSMGLSHFYVSCEGRHPLLFVVHCLFMNVCLVKTKIQCLLVKQRAGMLKSNIIKIMCPTRTQGSMLSAHYKRLGFSKLKPPFLKCNPLYVQVSFLFTSPSGKQGLGNWYKNTHALTTTIAVE